MTRQCKLLVALSSHVLHVPVTLCLPQIYKELCRVYATQLCVCYALLQLYCLHKLCVRVIIYVGGSHVLLRRTTHVLKLVFCKHRTRIYCSMCRNVYDRILLLSQPVVCVPTPSPLPHKCKICRNIYGYSPCGGLLGIENLKHLG